ncbi:YHYH protein [Granulosicoccus sp. 3-233]|uniref:YHYH protein n=1 Tax=Granulosicoccus sp. 3-233 TaxID=3417969 RepID=UPI003D34C716
MLRCALLGLMLHVGHSQAHETDPTPQGIADHCALIKDSVEQAGFADQVSVSCENGFAYLSSSSYPDHELMTGIVGSNEQVPIPAVGYSAPVPLQATPGSTPKTRDAALAIAVNGVPIFDYTGGGEMSEQDLHHHQTQHDTLLTEQLDACGGHAGRGDDYHYHMAPGCMMEAMENAGDAAIIGWAFDGFPLFGNNNPDGTKMDEQALDVCNGQTDETFGYRYHTSDEAPYIIQCLMGNVPDFDRLPRIAPLRPAEGSEPMQAGRPPAGGVDDLVFTQFDSGSRSLDYSYQGEAYYIRYKPSDSPACYELETRTVTNNGVVKTGVYCR